MTFCSGKVRSSATSTKPEEMASGRKTFLPNQSLVRYAGVAVMESSYCGRQGRRFSGRTHQDERALGKGRINEQGGAGEGEAKVDVMEKQKRR